MVVYDICNIYNQKRIISRIYISYKSVKEMNNTIRKLAGHLKTRSQNTQIANVHEKMLNSLIIQEIKLKPQWDSITYHQNDQNQKD